MSKIDPLSLSDDDFAKLTPEELAQLEGDVDEPTDPADPVDLVEPVEPSVPADPVDPPDDDDDDSADPVDPPEATEPLEPAEPQEPVDPAKAPADPKPAEPKAAPAQEPTGAIDYKTEYERLIAPFKANGRDIQVKTVDDAITLMQMGANYNKKMAALKPSLKVLKLLENNDLLSEDKLSFLIDLHKKDPGAINKLVQDSGVNPLDLNEESAKAYKPNSYTVDEREMALDGVLDELKDTPTYNTLLEVVSTKWDVASKKVVADHPQILKLINNQMQSGIYDLVMAEIDSERTFGRLTDKSDLEAYNIVGDALHAKGAFNHLTPSGVTKPAAAPVEVTPPAVAKPVDDKVKDKKRAASSTKPASVSTPLPADFNPLALSDDEFQKLGDKRFL